MKNIIILIFSIFLYSNYISGQSDELIVPFDPSMNKGLKIIINEGNIEIKGTDRKDIFVRYAYLKQPTTENEKLNSEGLKRFSIRKSSIDIQVLDEMVQITDSAFSSELEIYIEVPVNININTFKGGHGSLKISNISGKLNLENGSGSIVATGINGLVNASTGNGGIKVEFMTLPDNYTMILTNLIGDIEIDLPKERKASFRMKTKSGELFSNLNLQLEESKSRQENNSEGGFKYSNDTWVKATLNSGGPSMTISTLLGDIIIRGR